MAYASDNGAEDIASSSDSDNNTDAEEDNDLDDFLDERPDDVIEAEGRAAVAAEQLEELIYDDDDDGPADEQGPRSNDADADETGGSDSGVSSHDGEDEDRPLDQQDQERIRTLWETTNVYSRFVMYLEYLLLCAIDGHDNSNYKAIMKSKRPTEKQLLLRLSALSAEERLMQWRSQATDSTWVSAHPNLAKALRQLPNLIVRSLGRLALAHKEVQRCAMCYRSRHGGMRQFTFEGIPVAGSGYERDAGGLITAPRPGERSNTQARMADIFGYQQFDGSEDDTGSSSSDSEEDNLAPRAWRDMQACQRYGSRAARRQRRHDRKVNLPLDKRDSWAWRGLPPPFAAATPEEAAAEAQVHHRRRQQAAAAREGLQQSGRRQQRQPSDDAAGDEGDDEDTSDDDDYEPEADEAQQTSEQQQGSEDGAGPDQQQGSAEQAEGTRSQQLNSSDDAETSEQQQVQQAGGDTTSSDRSSGSASSDDAPIGTRHRNKQRNQCQQRRCGRAAAAAGRKAPASNQRKQKGRSNRRGRNSSMDDFIVETEGESSGDGGEPDRAGTSSSNRASSSDGSEGVASQGGTSSSGTRQQQRGRGTKSAAKPTSHSKQQHQPAAAAAMLGPSPRYNTRSAQKQKQPPVDAAAQEALAAIASKRTNRRLDFLDAPICIDCSDTSSEEDAEMLSQREQRLHGPGHVHTPRTRLSARARGVPAAAAAAAGAQQPVDDQLEDADVLLSTPRTLRGQASAAAADLSSTPGKRRRQAHVIADDDVDDDMPAHVVQQQPPRQGGDTAAQLANMQVRSPAKRLRHSPAKQPQQQRAAVADAARAAAAGSPAAGDLLEDDDELPFNASRRRRVLADEDDDMADEQLGQQRRRRLGQREQEHQQEEDSDGNQQQQQRQEEEGQEEAAEGEEEEGEEEPQFRRRGFIMGGGVCAVRIRVHHLLQHWHYKASARLLEAYEARKLAQAGTGMSDAEIIEATIKELTEHLFQPAFKGLQEVVIQLLRLPGHGDGLRDTEEGRELLELLAAAEDALTGRNNDA